MGIYAFTVQAKSVVIGVLAHYVYVLLINMAVRYCMFRSFESVKIDDPVLELDWEDLSLIGGATGLDLSLKNSLSKFLRNYGEHDILEDLYHAVTLGLSNLQESGIFDGFVSNPDIEFRGKTNIIQHKLDRHHIHSAGRPLEKVFNDLIGIRIIVEDYSVWESVKHKFDSSVCTVVDMRCGKFPDDGYRAVHVYFQADHLHYPVELQFVSEHDSQFNAWQHDHAYKSSWFDPSVGKKLRELYDDGKIQTEDEYVSELTKLSSMVTYSEKRTWKGTKLVACRFGIKGCIGYIPKTIHELMYLYRELCPYCRRQIQTVDVTVVKGESYAEFSPCTIYATYTDFYAAIFHDLLRKPERQLRCTP